MMMFPKQPQRIFILYPFSSQRRLLRGRGGGGGGEDKFHLPCKRRYNPLGKHQVEMFLQQKKARVGEHAISIKSFLSKALLNRLDE